MSSKPDVPKPSKSSFNRKSSPRVSSPRINYMYNKLKSVKKENSNVDDGHFENESEWRICKWINEYEYVNVSALDGGLELQMIIAAELFYGGKYVIFLFCFFIRCNVIAVVYVARKLFVAIRQLDYASFVLEITPTSNVKWVVYISSSEVGVLFHLSMFFCLNCGILVQALRALIAIWKRRSESQTIKTNEPPMMKYEIEIALWIFTCTNLEIVSIDGLDSVKSSKFDGNFFRKMYIRELLFILEASATIIQSSIRSYLLRLKWHRPVEIHEEVKVAVNRTKMRLQNSKKINTSKKS